MIRIIKPGTKRRVICSNCNAVFEFEHEDVTIEQTGYMETSHTIECPCCLGTLVLLDHKHTSK